MLIKHCLLLFHVKQECRGFQSQGLKCKSVRAIISGGKYIAAYVVSDSEVDIHALNNFIKETKPPYMVPAVTMQIDKIPLNQNQKVNKKALPRKAIPEKGRRDRSASKYSIET